MQNLIYERFSQKSIRLSKKAFSRKVHRITKDIRPEDQNLTSSGPRNNSGNGLYLGVQSVREQTDYLYPGQELELLGPSTVYFRWVIDVLLIRN